MPRGERSLVTPHRPAEQGPPPPAGLYREPVEDILIVGEMLHDVRTMDELLRRLPFDREHYRANLRIVAGAAVRTRERCERLLGEEREIEPGLRTYTAEPTIGGPDPMDLLDKMSSEIIDGQVVKAAEPDPPKPAISDAMRKRRNLPPNGAYAFTAVESFIMSTLKELGTASTKGIIEAVCKNHRVPADQAHEALATLRVAKKVTTSTLGRSVLNRIA